MPNLNDKKISDTKFLLKDLQQVGITVSKRKSSQPHLFLLMLQNSLKNSNRKSSLTRK